MPYSLSQFETRVDVNGSRNILTSSASVRIFIFLQPKNCVFRMFFQNFSKCLHVKNYNVKRNFCFIFHLAFIAGKTSSFTKKNLISISTLKLLFDNFNYLVELGNKKTTSLKVLLCGDVLKGSVFSMWTQNKFSDLFRKGNRKSELWVTM